MKEKVSHSMRDLVENSHERACSALWLIRVPAAPGRPLSENEAPSGICCPQQNIAFMPDLSSGMLEEAVQWTHVSELAELSGWSESLRPLKDPSVLPGVAGTENELTLHVMLGHAWNSPSCKPRSCNVGPC